MCSEEYRACRHHDSHLLSPGRFYFVRGCRVRCLWIGGLGASLACPVSNREESCRCHHVYARQSRSQLSSVLALPITLS
jgi:hypothetical protein